MTTYTPDTAKTNPAARYLDEQRKSLLVAKIEQLAGTRFSIILTAKWETSDTVTAERRGELRSELSSLRALYMDQIDEIAMTFGVQTAMEIKEEVERTVSIPKEMNPSRMPIESDQLYF
jgi:hypothetical protein